MERTCEQAISLGLRSVAFTDHADFTGWTILEGISNFPSEHMGVGDAQEGTFTPPALDIARYRESVERCRSIFPEIEILFGVELSEPHWNPDEAARLLEEGDFDLVICGLHSLQGPEEGRFIEIASTYEEHAASEVVTAYLTELLRMVEGWDRFDILAHIDYPIRSWPGRGEEYSPEEFEEPYRAVLRALAGSERTLEVNTRLPLDARVVSWWREEGGRSVSFGSDAHDPLSVGRGFEVASAFVEAAGFRPGRHRHDLWTIH